MPDLKFADLINNLISSGKLNISATPDQVKTILYTALEYAGFMEDFKEDNPHSSDTEISAAGEDLLALSSSLAYMSVQTGVPLTDAKMKDLFDAFPSLTAEELKSSEEVQGKQVKVCKDLLAEIADAKSAAIDLEEPFHNADNIITEKLLKVSSKLNLNQAQQSSIRAMVNMVIKGSENKVGSEMLDHLQEYNQKNFKEAAPKDPNEITEE